MRANIGVIEGFFGPEWSWKDRASMCDFVSAHGGRFYIYAPKRDPFLRKAWKKDHPREHLDELVSLRSHCRNAKIDFGVGLSPFEIHEEWNQDAKNVLGAKIKKLDELEIDRLGLFFDDMRGSPDLAEKQSEIVEFVRSVTKTTLLFCPTYYSDDPILDKVFGARPARYLEKIGANLSSDVEILWTGSKVISQMITGSELKDVAKILKRKPFLWDNYFANDGPRQCKYLRLKPFAGRSREAFDQSSGWALNPMNQANLSKIAFLASVNVLLEDGESDAALKTALEALLSPKSASFIFENAGLFTEKGLDKIDGQEKQKILDELKPFDMFTFEIADWLEGNYIVGPECLTD